MMTKTSRFVLFVWCKTQDDDDHDHDHDGSFFYAPIKYSTQITQYTDIRIKSISMQIKAF